jgi:hypothetical protein
MMAQPMRNRGGTAEVELAHIHAVQVEEANTIAPSPALFRHFVAEAEGQVGSLYGRLSTASEGSG